MATNLENAIANYHATVSNQNTFWNFYFAVAFGLLAFLGSTEDISVRTESVTIAAFAVFCVCNLSMICLIHRKLVATAHAIQSYYENHEDEVPTEFRGIVTGLTAIPLPIVVLFHVAASVGFVVVMRIVCF